MPQKADDPNFKGFRQRVKTENEGAYFHIMLNMADDELPPFEYRLLGHYIRVGSDCWEGIRTTSKKTQMSVGMVSKTRDELVRKGYISVEYRDNNASCIVTVIDRMAENVARYQKKQGVHTVNTPPVHEVNTSVHTVNERITIEEEQDIAATPNVVTKHVKEYLIPVFTAVANHIFKLTDFSTLSDADVKRYRAMANIAWTKAGGKNTPVDEIARLIGCYAKFCNDNGYTPPQAQLKFSSGFDAYLQNNKPRPQTAPAFAADLPEYVPDMTPVHVPAYDPEWKANGHD